MTFTRNPPLAARPLPHGRVSEHRAMARPPPKPEANDGALALMDPLVRPNANAKKEKNVFEGISD